MANDLVLVSIAPRYSTFIYSLDYELVALILKIEHLLTN